MINLEFLGRLLLAGVCGAVVGYERKRQLKEAGVRTHFIVSMAAALVMIVSKYGFMDVASLPGHSVDVSRVAASVVSGVGFLGAGLIFVRKYTINGLTTAAGIWATSAIGMAIGGGMYAIGIMSALVILLAQVFLHRRWKFMRLPSTEQLRLLVENEENAVQEIYTLLENNRIEILNIKMEIEDTGYIKLDMTTKLPTGACVSTLLGALQTCPYVKTADL